MSEVQSQWEELNQAMSAAVTADLSALKNLRNKRALAIALRTRLDLPSPVGRATNFVDNWLSGQLLKSSGQFTREQVLETIENVFADWAREDCQDDEQPVEIRSYVSEFLNPVAPSASEPSSEPSPPGDELAGVDRSVAEWLRAAKALENQGDYGAALAQSEEALAAASELPDSAAEKRVSLARARAAASHRLLLVDGDVDRAWTLADLAADAAALSAFPETLFDVLLNKAEAAFATKRVSVAKGAIAAASDLTVDDIDERSLLQVRAHLALIERDASTASSLYDEAAQSFLRQLAREADLSKRPRLKVGVAGCLHNKGIALRGAGDIGAACEAFAKAATWYGEGGSPIDESVARRFLARTHFDHEEWDSGFAEIDKAIALAKASDFLPGALEALELRARALATTGQPTDSVVALEEALALALRINDEHTQRRHLQMLATLDVELGKRDSAKERLTEALALAQRSGDLLAVADVEHQMAHGPERAMEPAPDAVIAALARDIRTTELPAEAARKSQQLAGAYRSRGDLDAATTWHQRALERSTAISDWALAASAHIGLADIAIERDDDPVATSHIESAMELADRAPDIEVHGSLMLYRAMLKMRSGQLRDAKDLLQAGLDLARRGRLNHLTVGLEEHLERVNTELMLYSPAPMTFGQLSRELADLEAWYPEQRQALRRLWWYWRDTEVMANIRSQAGPKALIVCDDSANLHGAQRGLSTLFDLTVYSAATSFASDAGATELVPFPDDRPLPEYVNVLSADEMQAWIAEMTGDSDAATDG